MKIVLALGMILSGFCLTAQDFYFSKYDWKEVPDTYELTAEEKKEDQVIVKERISTHLVQRGNDLVEYNLKHKIILLNTDKAIERYNKYYVSTNGAIKVEMQKARVIKPNGKIIVLSEKDIKSSKNENGEVEYQYFAFEGVELGSYIEYLDIAVYPPSLSGGVLKVQSDVMKKNVEVDVITPSHIEYQLLCVNGLPDFVKDSTALFLRRMVLKLDKIEALQEESWSAYDLNLKKVYFKFQRNTSSNKANFYNYGNASQNIHERLFALLNKKEAALVKKFIQKSQADKAPDVIDKVRLLENAMKKEIATIDNYFDQSEDITFILTKKITTEVGMNKLMINCLRELGINFELVMTCDRNDNKFIPKYEAYNFLKEYLIYIRDIDRYFSANFLTRVGFPPEELTFTEGLFISEVKIGDMVTGVGKVKYITGPSVDKSVDQMNSKVTFAPDFVTANVDFERTTTGYKAMPYQSVLGLMDEERRTDLKNDYVQYVDPDSKIISMSFENEKGDDYGVKPLVGKAVLESAHFVEMGGDKFLFKIGMLIGPQSELYNKLPRKLPVETPYTRKYNRVIEVVIPEGYSLKNTDILSMQVVPDTKNKSMGFTSDYTIEGNKLRVEVNEWYNDVHYTLEEYPAYEKVINAAADFNKLIVVFQKN